MASDGEMNVGVLAADGHIERLHLENYKLKQLCRKMAEELLTSGISYHLVKEAKELTKE